jgi:thaumarchaeosortase
MMGNPLQVIKKNQRLLLKLLPIIAFAVPLLWLYLLEPSTFELMWKGRTFQLFFFWLVGLELILGWEDLKECKICKVYSARTIALIASLALPTMYVAVSYYWGLNGTIVNWATQSHIQWASSMPLSTEYLVFAALFGAIVSLSFGFKGLKAFSVPAFFLVIVGLIYTIDNVFPYGQFTPFQIFVPTTTVLAAAILNLMGYTTSITYCQSSLEGNMPFLTSTDPHHLNASATFSIAWPCAGIESFLIFTVVILLFLKRSPISWKAKIGYFAFGVAVTYVINALRIVSIFNIGMQYGAASSQVDLFHFYYGPLYAVAWIVSYPLIILLSQNLWHRIKKPKPMSTEAQLPSLNPA